MPARALIVAALLALSGSAAGQSLQNVPLDKPGHPDDLLVGPAQVTVVRKDSSGRTEEKAVTLLFLTRTQAVYKERPDGSPVVHGNGRVRLVYTPDKKQRWEWDDAQKRFTGDPAPPRPIGIVASRLDADHVAGYLVTRAEFLHLELNNALFARNEKRVDSILEYAGEVRRSARPAEVAKLFDLAKYAKDQQGVLKEMAQEAEALRQKKADAGRALDAARARHEQRAQLAMLRALAGGGVAYAADDPDLRDRGLAVAAGGVNDVLTQAAAIHRLEQLAADELRALYADAAAKFTDLNRRYDSGRGALAGQVVAAWKKLGVDPEKVKRVDALADALLAKQDLSATVEVFDARLRYAASRGAASPQLVVKANNLKAVVHDGTKALDARNRGERSEEIFKLAADTVAATRLIPDAAVFDADRAYVLAAAGKLVLRAVTYAHGPTNWSACYDPRADYGVRVLDLALGYGLHHDADGSARAARAALLFLRGLPREALQQAVQVEKMRESDPAAMLHLARCHAANDATRAESVGCFEKALKAGLRDLKAAEGDPDLRPMWATKSDLWKHRDAPDKFDVFAEASPVAVGQQLRSYTVEIRNKTRYPLTNIKVKYVGHLPAPFGRPAQTETSKEVTIDYLGPAGSASDTYYWVDAFRTDKTYTKSELFAVLPDRKFGGKAVSGFVPVKAAVVNPFRPYWYWY